MSQCGLKTFVHCAIRRVASQFVRLDQANAPFLARVLTEPTRDAPSTLLELNGKRIMDVVASLWVRANPFACTKCVDVGDFVDGQCEVENVDVVADAALRDRL